MDITSSQGDGTLEVRVEKLAAILDRYSLTHLAYQDGQTDITLKRESTVLPVSPEIPQQTLKNPQLDERIASEHTSHTGSHVSQVQEAERLTYRNANQESTVLHYGNSSEDSADSIPSDAIVAPLVGIAYRAKEPGSTPFVSIGDEVEEGTVLCLIEAMKMFNEVKAPHTGIIHNIHFTDGELVEFGAPLFSIRH